MSIFSENFKKYLDRGYSIIPTVPASKKPSIKDWPVYGFRMPSALEIQDWLISSPDAGIGISFGVGNCIVAVDVDLHLDRNWDGEVYEKIKHLIPDSPVEKKGKKGFTRFYKHTGQKTTRIKVGRKSIVEILSVGSFTVLPPSIHPDTNQPYTWTGKIELCNISASQLPTISDDTIKKLQEIISKIPVPLDADSVGGRNDTLKKHVVAAIHKNKSDDEIADEILNYDQNNHNPPLFSDKNDSQMANSNAEDNALRFVQNIRCFLNRAIVNNDNDRLSFNTLAELYDQEEEKIQWVVDGMLPSAAVSIVAAKPKCGKSTLSRQLGFCVAKGINFLGRTVAKGTVVYVAPEEKKFEVRRHFEDMGADRDCDIRITTELPKQNRLLQLSEYINQHRPTLVIIDTIFRFLQIADGNNYNLVTAALEPICELARSSGTHIMLIHHRGKGEKTGGDSILGSTAIFAAVDTAITMDKADSRRTIRSEQRYGANLEETILTFDPDHRLLSLGDSKSHVQENVISEKILTFLTGQPAPVGEQQIIQIAGGATGTGRKVLRSLHERGLVERYGKGKKGDPYLYSIGEISLPSLNRNLKVVGQ